MSQNSTKANGSPPKPNAPLTEKKTSQPTTQGNTTQNQPPRLFVRTHLQSGNYWDCVNQCTRDHGMDNVCLGYCLFDI
ncbi:MAG TPA: hypothetical protein VFD70_02170 [Anaerolineae bacterium]|nr:hypothetical protein [Anaerolineae bacterium]